MKSFMVSLVGLVLSVSVGAEPLLKGRVWLASGPPAAGVHVRLFDLTDLRRSVGTTTDEAGYFALPLATVGGPALPDGFALGQNYPNPFNPSTIIPYQIPTTTHVRLEVFNLLGQRLATLVDGARPAGAHTAQWDATDAAGRAVGAGVFIYRLTGGGHTVSRRMVLLDGQAGIPAGAVGPRRAPALERTGAEGAVYGLTVAGAGLIAYVDPAFRVGTDQVDLVLEQPGGQARMKVATGGILGDVNNDSQVDEFDVLYVALYSQDPSITLPNNGDISLGDVNRDGTVDLADGLLLALYTVNPSDPTLPPGIGQPVDGSGDDHGDDLSTATPVAPGSQTPGVLTAGDNDFFRVEINTSGTLSAGTSGSLDTYGYLYDGDGNRLAENDDTGAGSNFLVSAEVEAGTYYIRVRGYRSNTTGDYTLLVEFAEDGEADDHGDDRSTATPVAPDSQTQGTLTSGDVDYYRVEINRSGTLSATTTGSTDTFGYIEDSTGDVLDSNDDTAESGINFLVEAEVDAGTYYIQVRGYNSSTSGDYSLHVRFTEAEQSNVGRGSEFNIELVFLDDFPAFERQVWREAADRWEKVLYDLPDVTIARDVEVACGWGWGDFLDENSPTVDRLVLENGRVIDDIIILVSHLEKNDSAWGLGGIVLARNWNWNLPYVGCIEMGSTREYFLREFIEEAPDWWFSEENPRKLYEEEGPWHREQEVFLAQHEIGHALGIGTSGDWRDLMRPPLSQGVQRAHFSGENANREYDQLPKITGIDEASPLTLFREHRDPLLEYPGGSLYRGEMVPLELGFDSGHWGMTLAADVMKGSWQWVFHDPHTRGLRYPVSRISTVSLGALDDMGYSVNYTKADPLWVEWIDWPEPWPTTLDEYDEYLERHLGASAASGLATLLQRRFICGVGRDGHVASHAQGRHSH